MGSLQTSPISTMAKDEDALRHSLGGQAGSEAQQKVCQELG